MMNIKWEKRRKRISDIIEVGSDYDWPSRVYDFTNAGAIIFNLTASILYTFAEMRERFGLGLLVIEQMTIAFFLVDYVLRVWTAKYKYEGKTQSESIRKYVLSFTGVIDLLSFLPYYLPFAFPAGTVAFRMVRLVRIFRLFRINSYYDALTVIGDVLKAKRQQLISSVFIIMILMLASSLCMYSLENKAQPEVFSNAFSGIWWAASTLLTVGYGDIYPITTLGKLFGILIAFLGVGMVAIPTGIISAGFVDQYSNIKKKSSQGFEMDMQFIRIPVAENDPWVGKRIADLDMPVGAIISILIRDDEIQIPRGDVILQKGDSIILGAEPFAEHKGIRLTEVMLRAEHPWMGQRICDLDISRHSIIILVKRKNKAIIPHEKMVLKEWDKVFMYTDQYMKESHDVVI